MDLELKKVPLDHYVQTWDNASDTEETLEMIVPDACPDILRVVDTSGQVLLLQREEEGGSVKLSGLFRLSVLYQPDGESGLCDLPVSIPFTCRMERSGGESGALLIPRVELTAAETRVLNPRKILVRAQAHVAVQGFSLQRGTICTGLGGESADGMEQLIESKGFYLIASAGERQFTCSDEVELPSGKPAIGKILGSHFHLELPESKIIGNKLIAKGQVQVRLLCQEENGGAFPVELELGYSQILEVSGVGEKAESDLYLTLAGASCELQPGSGGRTVSLSVDVLLQAVVWDTIELPVLTDAYDLSGAVQVERRDRTAICQGRGELRRQPVRERWEVTEPVADVLGCRLLTGPVEGKEQMELPYTVEVLCRTEEEQLLTLRHSFTVACPRETAEGERCRCEGFPLTMPAVTPGSGSMELRFEQALRYRWTTQEQFPVVEALQSAEEDVLLPTYPSVVLRALEPGERLWDVAKSYRTTIADIMAANELEGEEPPERKLLLIPRKR